MGGDYEVTKEMKEHFAKIMEKEKRGELKFMSAQEFEKKSAERLEQIIKSKKNAS